MGTRDGKTVSVNRLGWAFTVLGKDSEEASVNERLSQGNPIERTESYQLGDGVMAQQCRALTALTEDPGCAPCTHMIAHSSL